MSQIPELAGLLGSGFRLVMCRSTIAEHGEAHRAETTGTLLPSDIFGFVENGSKNRFRQPDRSDDATRQAWAWI